MRIATSYFHFALLACLLSGLGGCVNLQPKAQPDQTRFYLLAPPPAPPVQGPIDLSIRRVELAEYLESSRLAVRVNEYEVEYWPFHRWSGSLEEMIGRTLAAGMEQARDGWRISTGPGGEIPQLLDLRILRFDGTPNDAVEVSFEWTLIREGERAPQARGRITKRAQWADSEAGTLVATLARLLEEASQELADSIDPPGGSAAR